ncbi:hypothetical protein LMG33818_000796 [Halomonadaceae bacterium LMG 33818]|uniref:hypothetical protein n=1 Tax=Cernens ardua TaxID=3402176 RepID=UPI003EDB6FEF
MSIFDVDKDELPKLSDIQLEEMIARLCEAEVAAQGYSPACVSWSGSINASDEGIDIHVQVPVDAFKTGFVPRSDTVFQAKKHSMSRKKITGEMIIGEDLSKTISRQALKGGGYIIVSLGDDCSPKSKAQRLSAMKDAVKLDPNESNIYLDFYDRAKLAQWVRQHPSVLLWVKQKLGQGYSGWRPYGSWSNPPHGVDDTLILAPGVVVMLPSNDQKLSIEDALEPMRNLIRTSSKAIRIMGLSGVGKTRIVQALFDDKVGANALDRTIAVYVDTGDEPNPSAAAMLDRLIAEDRKTIMVLDNCPPELHSALAGKVSASFNKVSLITVEYDIRDDKPQTTEVIHIEAVGPEVAEQLLNSRFPSIGQKNTRRIAEFADGNTRVALAIAERVLEGESLAQLSDAQLFKRLFVQRNHADDDLQDQAEILSLVYSFSVVTPDTGQKELEILGSISGYSSQKLRRSVKKLLDRHIVQKRSHWRAILPQAIANRLAASALDSIPVDELRETFEASGRERLLMSFAHRLGLLHDHPVALEIAEAWLQPDGLLGQILELDDTKLRMLNYVSPVVPAALLNRIESALTAPEFIGWRPRYDASRTIILNLLRSLAYEPNVFSRCVRLLIRVADHEDENNKHDSVQTRITRFFQAYLSGTHASLQQRVDILNECLLSDVAGRRALGFEMLTVALGPHWTSGELNEFGARPRDFGFNPTYDQFVEWRSVFIDIAVRFGTSGDTNLENSARQILAKSFSGLWCQEAIRDKLIDAARKLNNYQYWEAGWQAARSIIYFSHVKRKNEDTHEPLSKDLLNLERELKPNGLVPEIMAYVLSNSGQTCALDSGFDHYESMLRLEAKALKLGEGFAASDHELNELGPKLFSNHTKSRGAAFGRGLAKGAYDLRASWQNLIAQLKIQPETTESLVIFEGFIEEVDSVDPVLAQELLDQCALHSEFRNVLVDMHPRRTFTETDLDRCMKLLDDPDTHAYMYESILWRPAYANLPEDRIVNLAQRLLNKPNGDDLVLDALSMKLHDKETCRDLLGLNLRTIGLRAAIQRLQRDHMFPIANGEYNMECVIRAVLSFDDNESEKLEWLDTIVSVIDKHYGHIYTFESAIETTVALMPEAFLDRVFARTDDEQYRRVFLTRYSDRRQPLLAQIDIGTLIEWCRAKNDTNVWASVAGGINLWIDNEDKRSVTISGSAVKYLESSPHPEAVLRTFAGRVMPLSWSGSPVGVMQARAAAIYGLVSHENSKIAEAAGLIHAQLVKDIEDEEVLQQKRNEEREQRFE